MIDAFGLLGFFTSIVMFLPLVHGVWKNRNDDYALKSQSVWMQILWLANAVFWAIYGIGVGAIFTALPSFINFPLACFNLYLVARSKLRDKQRVQHEREGSPVCGCGYPQRDGHKLFITAAPGYGSIINCDGSYRKFAVPIPNETAA